jgi:hypothetical protein
VSGRRLHAVVFLLAFVAAAATIIWLEFRPVLRSPGPGANSAAGQRWYQLSADRRQQCIDWYRRLHRRPDYAQVLREARAFAGLSQRQRDRLRYLNTVLDEIIEKQPAHRRRFLLGLPPPARAVELYRTLEQEAPSRLAEVRAELSRRF